MTGQNDSFNGFRKRDGTVVPFRREKIEKAIRLAAEAVARREGAVFGEDLPVRIAERVLRQLDDARGEYYVFADEHGQRIPAIEDVQDLVEITLAEQGCTSMVAAYKRYRKQRDLARRRIRVRDAVTSGTQDVTDASLLLVSASGDSVVTPWDRRRIVNQLVNRAGLSVERAVEIAKVVENQVIDGRMTAVTTALIRDLVNNELLARREQARLRDLSVYGVPREYVESLMFTKSVENSNIVNNNPEAVNLGIAELVLKQWALDTIFSGEVRRAHDTGAIHLHDLGYPHRVYCSSHSVEYVKKFGLRGLANLNNESKPARSASVLTGHINTFLASMQANYAGALGLGYINILYAPYLVGMDAKHLRQVAQELVFNGAQNAFSRGGQTLFLDFNVHSGVPRYLATVPAVGPGGHYMLRRADGSVAPLEDSMREEAGAAHPLMDLHLAEADGSRRLVLRETARADGSIGYDESAGEDLKARGEAILTYGDFRREAMAFARALLDVWAAGDRNGRVFEFPKCDFHVSAETFEDPDQFAIYLHACELAGRNGSTYFIFDRDEVTLAACCRLRTTVTDTHMLRHPESLRFCGFQNVTINIPQAAYRAARAGRKTLEGLLEEVDRTMETAVEAHVQKRERVREMMSGPGRPLWQIGRPACDGRPYVDLDGCTYILGLIGVNDAVQFLTGLQFHESDEAIDLGLRIVAHMNLKARRLAKKHGMKLTLEESPAESAARRLAKSDLIYYRPEALQVVKGGEDACYYTNSVHLAPDAPVSMVERIRKQSLFHPMIESGAITHAFVGEERPSPGAIARLIREAFYRTQSAQITISPEFTYCNDCSRVMRGLLDSCDECGSTNIEQETRVVGYFSKIHNWNKSKRHGELPARHRGDYAVERAECATAPDAVGPSSEPAGVSAAPQGEG